MEKEGKYKHFMEVEFPEAIVEGIYLCFSDVDIDPEAAWLEFREGLKKIKKKQTKLYLEYLETDDETPIPESEIAKWRRQNEL